MPHAALDISFWKNRKVLDAGMAATGLYALALAYCADELTDGFVPLGWAKMVGKPAICKKLEDVGLWEKVEGGYRIPAYLQHNFSRAKVEEIKQQKREAGRRGAGARWGNKGEEGMAGAMAPAMAERWQSDGPSALTQTLTHHPEADSDLERKSALDLGKPGSERERAALALLDEISDRDEATARFIASFNFPAAAFHAAREALLERRANTKRRRLVSEKRYVTSVLNDWQRDGRYGRQEDAA